MSVGLPPSWSCPVCHCRHYTQIKLSRGKVEFETQFFLCLGCSVAFMEPSLFASATRVNELFPLKGTMAHHDSNERLAVERRFWETRAKRLNGGIEATEEQIVDLWRRGRLE